jgi:uncharacterized protein (DUF983 family)
MRIPGMARTRAILLQRCPRCLHGKAFHGLASMRERCPECHFKFEREPGYFLGAMYASYFMAIPILLLLTLAIYQLFLPDWRLENVVLVAIVPFVCLVPFIFRYARILWMHIDAPPQQMEARSQTAVEAGDIHPTSR